MNMGYGLVAATLLSATMPTAAAAGETIFTCRAGQRTIAVIRRNDQLVYRSSRGGKVELELPGGRVAETGFSGGGEVQTRFVNGSWTYVLYTRIVRTAFGGRNDPRPEAGVDVLSDGRTVSRIGCDDPSTEFTIDGLVGVPEGEFVEH